jgi:capsid protein
VVSVSTPQGQGGDVGIRAKNYPDKIELPPELSGMVRATMDLTQTTHQNKDHWKDADPLSGRAALPHSVRKMARERSRLEFDNNSWYSGMLRTAANHIVGTGPRLQVLLDDAKRNAAIERTWNRWATAIGLTEKLKIAVITDWKDGEAFAMRAERPSLFPVTLDIRLYEGDQVSQPYWHVLDPSIEDGKRVDNLGNAVEYWIYDHHPGDVNIGHVNLLAGDWYRADDVCHLFRQNRPGQLRGLPRCSPALDFLAHMRRFDKATLSTAEKGANWGVFMRTNSSAVIPEPSPENFMSVEWDRDRLNFLPEGWSPEQLKAEHPGSTNEQYQRSSLMYFCRCANMPYSLAAGTSKDSNFSAANMDITNLWEPEVLGEQNRITQTLLASIFRWFLEDIMISTDLLDGLEIPISEIGYQFFWPPLPQSNETDRATAATARITSGQSILRDEYSRMGKDFETSMKVGAQDYGVTPEEFKKALFAKHFAIGGAPGGETAPKPEGERGGVSPLIPSRAARPGGEGNADDAEQKSAEDAEQEAATA